MMKLKKLLPILLVLAFSFIGYQIHDLALFAMGKEHLETEFHHSLQTVYGFFGLCSIVILTILMVIRKKNIDNVGNSFMLLTCIQIGIAYAFIYPVMQEDNVVAHFEKMNFLIVFGLFLTLETVLAIRILNSA